MQVYEQFHVDIMPPACNFIKKEIPAQVFAKFSTCNVIKNETPEHMFSR